MSSNKSLLKALVQTLVNEWGFDQVEAAVASAEPAKLRSTQRKTSIKLRFSENSSKPSAVEQIKHSSLDMRRKEILSGIAERYDHKQFLPSMADVREFLIMMGERPSSMRDRREAFKALTQSLMRVPADRLEELVNAALLASPSELGPLSEAIAASDTRLAHHQPQASKLPLLDADRL